jgi:Gpi18-like mannosyltransferase
MPADIFQIWNKWDTPHYLDIATQGYVNVGESRLLIVFFPLYPLLIHTLSWITQSHIISALIISNLAYGGCIYFLYRLSNLDFDTTHSYWVILFLSCFPTAYFLHIGYTESLFLLLTIFSFYMARKEHWLIASLLAALACTTRITGLILIPALFIEFLMQFKAHPIPSNFIKKSIFLLIIPLGFLIYLGINESVYDNPFHFLIYQKEHWHQNLTWPWIGLIGSFKEIFTHTISRVLTVGLPNFIFSILGFILSCIALWKLRLSYGVYAMGLWIMSNSTGFALSVPRYTLSIFPLFLVLPLLIRSPLLKILLLALFLLIHSIYAGLFILGMWAF